jgi:DNA-binding LytR/AlgR family response regulator
MNCIIIEDQPPAQRILKKYIGEIGSLNLVGTFSDAIQALAFLKTASVELIFLDIHLPKLSGIEFLKSMPHPPAVILTTAFSDYALESYELDVVDYLLKPFSFQRFVQAVAKVPNRQTEETLAVSSPERQELFIKSGYEHIKVVIDDILYIKSDADYTEIFVAGKKHLSSEPLRHWLELLGGQQFVRVHKSYVINADKVGKIAGNQLYLLDDRVIPIGRAYKEGVLERFLG